MTETAPRAEALVLYGITGDLAKKMLFPALYQLAKAGRLTIPVIGVAAPGWDDVALREHAYAAVVASVKRVNKGVFEKLAAQLSLVTGDLKSAAVYDEIQRAVAGHGFVTHYLAIPPSLFTAVAKSLAAVGLNKDSRLVVEKPFGHDLDSARLLDGELARYFDEEHLLRVDHFLGSGPVEGLKVSRFANTLFATTLHRSCVDNVQISLAEDFDVADRGSFYDAVGAVRDVFQNHLLQVLSFLTMEPPSNTDAKVEKLEKWRVLHAARTIDPADTVRGQYHGYLDVEGVAPDSNTETFVATRLWIDNWRWSGVPFYIRSGKCLALSATEIVVELRRPPIDLYPGADGTTPPNLIRFRLEPDAGLSIDLLVKKPDKGEAAAPVPVDVDFDKVLGREELPYENILDGAITGDREYFASFPVVEECWRICSRIIDTDDAPIRYVKGTWGPAAAELMPGPAGWHDIGEMGTA